MKPFRFRIPYSDGAARLLMLVLLTLGTAAVIAREPTGDTPSQAEIEQTLAEIEADESLDEVVRNNLTGKYRAALEKLAAAETFRQQTEDYRELLGNGADQVAARRAELETLESRLRQPPPALEAEARADPGLFLAREDARLTELRAERTRLAAKRETDALRPDDARRRIDAAEMELVELRERLDRAVPDTPTGQAQATAARVRRSMLDNEIAALRSELTIRPIRESLRGIGQAITEAEIELTKRRITQLEGRIAAHNREQADAADQLLDRLKSRHDELPEDLARPVAELERFSQALRDIGRETVRIERRQGLRQRELIQLRDTLGTFRKLLELGNLEGEFAEMFLQVLRNLPERRTLNQQLADIGGQIATARRSLYSMQDPEIPAVHSGEDAEDPYLAEILEQTHVMKRKLEEGYTRLIFQLTELETTERDYSRQAREFRAFATEKLFWVRSSPVVNADSFRSVPAGLAYCYGPGNLRKVPAALARAPWPLHLFMGGLVLGLVGGRRFFIRSLEEAGRANRRISTNRFTNTLKALLMTLLLALPVPLLMLALVIGLGWHPPGDEWSAGLRDGLAQGAAYLFVILTVVEICRKNGLGELHFGWRPRVLARSRRVARWSALIYLPAILTLGFVFAEGSNTLLNGLGRWTVLLLVLGLGLLLAYLLHPRHGLLAPGDSGLPETALKKTRKFWPPLIHLITATVIGLLLVGYIITAVMLVVQLGYVVLASLTAALVYALACRWLSINERRLAYEQAVTERRTRMEKAREASEAAQETTAAAQDNEIEAVTLAAEIEEEQNELDLARVNEHSRRLLRFVVGVSFLWSLYLIWSGFAPVTQAFDQFTVFGNVTVRDIVLTLIVITLTTSTVRNLPGLLEGLVLQKMNFTSGGRHTAITLAQYVAIAVGASFLFQSLGIDWSQFTWIAAALGVGIGFGLQEVVANFISGLILLFERPIRVGDVVTVDGIDGVVTKIQIRATTITGWDRKEFIVPNKNFVTGTLLNWTLTNAINRIEIPVGVAYGSDTEKARELLLEAASENSCVLEDPAPIASFQGFGDSALDMVLRAYLPDLANRLSTTHALHTAIDRKFKEAGIEIAFPQLDLHVRSKS